MYLSVYVRRVTLDWRAGVIYFLPNFAEVSVDIQQKILRKVLVRCELIKEKVQEERDR